MKVLRIVAAVVVALMVLNAVAFSVIHVLTHGKMFGKASGLVIDFATFPSEIKRAVQQITSKVKIYQLHIDPKFQHINHLDSDVYGLVSYNSKNADSLTFKLLDFKTESSLHEWHCLKTKVTTEGLCSNHPLLLENYNVIFKLDYDLYRLDSNSNLIWKNDSLMFHHALELDHEGNLWSPTTSDTGSMNINSKVINYETELSFRDDAITKVDATTGKILFTKSVAEILLENHYPGLVHGLWQYDPIHLNDIEPVFSDSKYWKKGDLFLSCRNIQTVFLYRPSTGKIIWLRTGLWSNQHDVDIRDSVSITIFNNNVNQNSKDFIFRENKESNAALVNTVSEPIKVNEIVVYHFDADSTSLLIPELMKREKIDTRSQGIFSALSNGTYFIEETDQGKIYVGNDEKTTFKMQLVSEDSSFVYYPGWSRIYEKIPPH